MTKPKAFLQSIRVGEEFAVMEEKLLFDQETNLTDLKLMLPKTILVKTKNERLLSNGSIQVIVNENTDEEYMTAASPTFDEVLAGELNPFESNERRAIEEAMLENGTTIELLKSIEENIATKLSLLENSNEALKKRLAKINKTEPKKTKIYMLS